MTDTKNAYEQLTTFVEQNPLLDMREQRQPYDFNSWNWYWRSDHFGEKIDTVEGNHTAAFLSQLLSYK